MEFDKPAKTFEEQIDVLIKRGLQVDDRDEAIHYLSQLNYYRFAAYCLPFEVSRDPHQFAEGANFTRILEHYLFDRELRLHMLDAIERIEVSFRTQWAYHISHQYGPHGYLLNNKSIRHNEFHLRSCTEQLTKSINESDESFIAHYRNKYDEALPPAWVSCEVMSLGLLSRFYANLRAYSVRQKIAATYQLDEGFLEGFMEHLSYVRNVCAHHSRLWNRHLSKKMPLPRGKPAGIKENIYIDEENKTDHKIYNTLVMVQYLMTVVSPASHWAHGLKNLIEKYLIGTKPMGFPDNWQALPIRQQAFEQLEESVNHDPEY